MVTVRLLKQRLGVLVPAHVEKFRGLKSRFILPLRLFLWFRLHRLTQHCHSGPGVGWQEETLRHRFTLFQQETSDPWQV